MALAAWRTAEKPQERVLFQLTRRLQDVRPRAVFADEAVGLAQRDDLARVPLAA